MNGLISYQIDNELLLYSENHKRVYSLNTLGSYIYLCLDDELTEEQIFRSIAEQFSVPFKSTERDVRQINQEIQSITQLPIEPLQDEVSVDIGFVQLNQLQSQSRAFYTLLDSKIIIRFSNKELKNQINSIIGHLEIDESNSYEIKIDIIVEKDGYQIVYNKKIANSCNNIAELESVVIYEFTRLAYQYSAVVGNGEYCMMLPGLSGSGESTLTAALVASVFKYFIDETAILKSGYFSIVPVPISIGIKEGSRPVLQSFYPNMNNLRVHSGIEERSERYLTPRLGSIPESHSEGKHVKCIIFPQFVAGKSTDIKRISPVEGLKLLTEAGYETKNNLNTEKVNELVEGISKVGCYHLEYSSLSDVTPKIRRIFDAS